MSGASLLRLPTWMVLWFIVSTLIVFADVAFILTRPHSMAKGIYSHFPMWNMYPLYYSIDKLYGDMDNAFVVAQSWMNLVENCGNILGLLVYRFVSKASGALILLIAVTGTLAKTILYMMHEHASTNTTKPFTSHNFADNLPQYFLVYILPNSFWIIVPALCVRNLFNQFRNILNGTTAAVATKKSK